ncbi:MAG TPA: hypothetical protein PLU49_10710, partial [Saprospiraceae bacterium]|nr:hypothetical protein [Saprospiraceae bacterium]
MNLNPSSASLLISLSTHPNFQIDEYLNSVISNLKSIKETRQNTYGISDKFEMYFEPLAYVILGYWDIGLLTVSDDSEIITKILQPEFNDNYNLH